MGKFKQFTLHSHALSSSFFNNDVRDGDGRDDHDGHGDDDHGGRDGGDDHGGHDDGAHDDGDVWPSLHVLYFPRKGEQKLPHKRELRQNSMTSF